jgi:hypothetical protein
MSGPGETDESPTKQELLLDGFRRLKTHSPVMMLPRLVLSQHLHQLMGAARRRTADSHKYLMRLLGEEVEPDDDGNISLQGDTTITNNYHAPRGAGWLKKLVSALALPAIGAGGLLAWQWWASGANETTAEPPATSIQHPASAAEAAVQDWKLGVIVTDGP